MFHKYPVLRIAPGCAPKEVARFDNLHDASDFAASCVYRTSGRGFACQPGPLFVVLGPGNYRHVYETPAVGGAGTGSGDDWATHRVPTGPSPGQIIAAYRAFRRELEKSTVVVFSADRDLLALAQKALPTSWKLEHVEDLSWSRRVLSRPKIELVIVDDESAGEESRGWLLDHIRRFAPSALLIYVAESHCLEAERRARAYAAQYYTAKPLDPGRTLRVLESFLRAIVERDGNSTPGVSPR